MKVVPYSVNRFDYSEKKYAVANDDGKIVDNANGKGFNSKERAMKAIEKRISKYYDLQPIAKPHSNMMLGGRPAEPNEKGVIGGKVLGLPVTANEYRMVSVWKCSSFWWRVKFLFTGEVTLTVLGKSHPCVSLSVGETV